MDANLYAQAFPYWRFGNVIADSRAGTLSPAVIEF